MFTLKKPALKKRVSFVLTHARLYVIRRPKLKRIVIAVLGYSPSLARRLKHLALSPVVAHSGNFYGAYEILHPTTRAQHIYAEIKVAMATRKKEHD